MTKAVAALAVISWGVFPPTEVSTELTWRPLRRADLFELFGLLTAIELHDDPSERHTLESLYARADDPSVPMVDHTISAWAGDTPVAYGWVTPGTPDPRAGADGPRRVWLSGGVHPGWRRMGHGQTVMRWQLDRTRAIGAVVRVQAVGDVDQTQTDRNRLFRRFGFEPVRWFADMSRPLTGSLPAVAAPEGFTLAPCTDYTDELSEAVRAAHNAAFTQHAGAQPVSRDDWRRAEDRSTFRPDLSWVARPVGGDQIAGYAMSSTYEQDWESGGPREGWTDRFGVRPEFRRRGLAHALLGRTMGSFAEAGLDAAGLGVDAEDPHRPFALYHSLGYVAADAVVRYRLDLTSRS